MQDITLEVVDSDGCGIGRHRNDGIGRVGEMETDQTVGLLNLRDGLAHEKAAIGTGMEERSRWRSGIGKGVMHHS